MKDMLNGSFIIYYYRYLTKKDFLNRCDVRSFELEREDRLKKSLLTMNNNTK